MPITLVSPGAPWAKLKVQTLSLGFNADGKSGEVKLKGLQLAADPENSVPGWLRIEEGSRDFVACEHNKPAAKQPNDKYVWTIDLPIYNQEEMGDSVYSICDTSKAYLTFAQQLYNQSEKKGFGKGTIPLIRIVDAVPTKMAKGWSAKLLFEIEEWIPRPDCFLEAIRRRDAAAAIKPDRSAGNSYAEATGRDPVSATVTEDAPPDVAPPMSDDELEEYLSR